MSHALTTKPGSPATDRPRSAPRVAGFVAFALAASLLSACAPHVSILGARPREGDTATRPARQAIEARRPATPGGPEVAAIPVAGSELVRARASVTIEASIDRVRGVVFDFARYPDFMPHYHAARVFTAPARGGHDVYMEIEELDGAIHLWARIHVSPAVVTAGVETYASRFMVGNVKDFRARWRLEPLGPERTRITVESFMDPNLPLPAPIINEGSLAGAREAIVALKARAEGR